MLSDQTVSYLAVAMAREQYEVMVSAIANWKKAKEILAR
jgi:hypothetical protein